MLEQIDFKRHDPRDMRGSGSGQPGARADHKPARTGLGQRKADTAATAGRGETRPCVDHAGLRDVETMETREEGRTHETVFNRLGHVFFEGDEPFPPTEDFLGVSPVFHGRRHACAHAVAAGDLPRSPRR